MIDTSPDREAEIRHFPLWMDSVHSATSLLAIRDLLAMLDEARAAQRRLQALLDAADPIVALHNLRQGNFVAVSEGEDDQE